MFTTPVLLLIFNRPDITRQAFSKLREVKPRYLYIAADGPRPGNAEDRQKCAAAREVIGQIDWPCELKTLFQSENLGCGYGPAQAITWFFDQVEQGIILEDDCLANETFFFFCQELLDRYKDNEKVSMIGGTNPLICWKEKKQSYVFTNMGFSWGWASWRRAWKEFDYSAQKWQTPEAKEKIKDHLGNTTYYNHYASEFDHYFKEVRSDVWDFQWLFCRLYMQSYTILPTVNLITNVGFNQDSTHTFNPDINIAHLSQKKLYLPLTHINLKIDPFFEWYLFERFINPQKRSVGKKTILKLAKLYVKYNENFIIK